MVRRSSSRFKVDDLAYPIRVKFVVPEGGMQGLSGRVEAWLNAELAPSAWSWGPAHSTGCRQATAYHFRSLSDAQRLVAAFPELQLADGVVARSKGTAVGNIISALVPAGSPIRPRAIAALSYSVAPAVIHRHAPPL